MKQIFSSLRSLTLVSLMLLFITGGVQAEPAPNFELPTKTDPISLQSLEGQVVYLDFWASWCKPCRKSFPWMNAMQAKYQTKGLQVVAVNVDSDSEQVKRFLSKYPAEFVVAYDPQGKIASRYQVKGMPSAYLIDRQGNIHSSHIGFRDEDKAAVETQINHLLQN
ncbi:MAG: TlpA family protein disulfide reductase [Gammaproteobacteria bacterium]|jgi:cytochrome c biogenesis protein CcmG/thiol:disulfide interchange protein DsbE